MCVLIFQVAVIILQSENMDDELGQVKAKIAATEVKLAKAEADGKETKIEMYGNLLVRLYDKEALLSAGKNIAMEVSCDIVWFLTL